MDSRKRANSLEVVGHPFNVTETRTVQIRPKMCVICTYEGTNHNNRSVLQQTAGHRCFSACYNYYNQPIIAIQILWLLSEKVTQIRLLSI